MKISEIFYSVQGEGILSGVPSVFIRTSGCNLRCTWCDTPYTSWNPEGGDVTLEQILAEVMKVTTGHIVVTGGEPMIAPQIVELTKLLRTHDQHITMETAGTVYVEVECDLMSISPKLRNSTPLTRDGGRWAAQHERTRLNYDVLKHLVRSYPHQMKFVVSAPEDMTEIRSIVRETGVQPEKVLLMPEGTDRDTLHERGLWIVELCKQTGYRYCPRLHVELWGAKRGV